MELKKYRWSKVYESAEEELHALLSRKNIDAVRWEADPATIFEPHVHSYNKRLWCVEGSIIFSVYAQTFSLQPGDALDVPANTMHEATAGLSGCVCYESKS